jgi:hypothetical protein
MGGPKGSNTKASEEVYPSLEAFFALAYRTQGFIQRESLIEGGLL